MFHLPLSSIRQQFGDIDIYLFDQLLKGRITKGMQLLDAGCGNGRNIAYLMQAGVHVFGADHAAEAIAAAQEMAKAVAPTLPPKNFLVADLASLPFKTAVFDVVVCSAVLHFARDEAHFKSMVQQLWRVLKNGGMLFCRLSTIIGLEGKFPQVLGRHYQMPHGPVWFLADEALLKSMELEMHAARLEPLKTVVVEQERSMTNWVLRKG